MWLGQRVMSCPRWDKLVNSRAKTLTQAPFLPNAVSFLHTQNRGSCETMVSWLQSRVLSIISLEYCKDSGKWQPGRQCEGDGSGGKGKIGLFLVFWAVRNYDLRLRERRKLPQTQRSRKQNVEEKEEGNSSCPRIYTGRSAKIPQSWESNYYRKPS